MEPALMRSDRPGRKIIASVPGAAVALRAPGICMQPAGAGPRLREQHDGGEVGGGLPDAPRDAALSLLLSIASLKPVTVQGDDDGPTLFRLIVGGNIDLMGGCLTIGSTGPGT